MKETVDLTENRLFSTSFHTEGMEVRHKFELPCYTHKDVPWERTDKGKLAKPVNLFNNVKITSINNNFIINNFIDVNFNVNFDNELHYGENLSDFTDSISFTIQRSHSHTNSSTFSPTFTYTDRNVFVSNDGINSDYHLSGYNIVKKDNGEIAFTTARHLSQKLRTYGEESLKDALDISHLVPTNFQIFPTGHKEEIIKARKLYQSYDTERDLRSRLRTVESKITCKICGKSIFRKEYEKKFLWETNLCESCYRIHVHKPKKISSSSEYFTNRFVRDDSDKFILKGISEYSRTPTRISQCIYEPIREDINKRKKERNCLSYYDSFYDEPEVHKYQKDNYNKFYLIWQEVPIGGSKNVRKLNHFEQAVYFKGREIERRGEPWQPLGRQVQWYDTLFDSMNWKDLFKRKKDLLSLQ